MPTQKGMVKNIIFCDQLKGVNLYQAAYFARSGPWLMPQSPEGGVDSAHSLPSLSLHPGDYGRRQRAEGCD